MAGYAHIQPRNAAIAQRQPRELDDPRSSLIQLFRGWALGAAAGRIGRHENGAFLTAGRPVAVVGCVRPDVCILIPDATDGRAAR